MKRTGLCNSRSDRFNALSGLYLISTKIDWLNMWRMSTRVNALSGLYLISTRWSDAQLEAAKASCQCPLGLIPHFYLSTSIVMPMGIVECQCPLGLIPHFYVINYEDITNVFISVDALSGLYLISTEDTPVKLELLPLECQCPLGLIPHFYYWNARHFYDVAVKCQCPLGLIPHFYTGINNAHVKIRLCQCPLGLIPHFYDCESNVFCAKSMIMCQCPLGLIPHFYEYRS